MTPTPLATRIGPGRKQRLACAIASLIVGAGLCSLVVGLFAHASSTPWLPDTPETVALASACQRLETRAARAACMQESVALWYAPERRQLRLASTPREHQKM
jgi:hypothetical protein